MSGERIRTATDWLDKAGRRAGHGQFRYVRSPERSARYEQAVFRRDPVHCPGAAAR
jgi:hypothetical protein